MPIGVDRSQSSNADGPASAGGTAPQGNKKSVSATLQPFLFPAMDPLREALENLKTGGVEERGAVFTKLEVVDFILDLVGYTPDQPLPKMRLLEPSFGGGDFLLPAVARLVESYLREAAGTDRICTDLKDAVRGVELHRATYSVTRDKVAALLERAGVPRRDALFLADHWLVDDDFLLHRFDGTFTHVVGNPPYVRQELIPDVVWTEYRDTFKTIYDRADIYVPFIEKSLGLLQPGGRLGFICADRWMKNRYGGPLRDLVSSRYHFAAYVDMVDTPAFRSEVMAYPAITVIAAEPAGPTRVAHRPSIDRDTLRRISAAMLGESADALVQEVPHVATGSGPWVLDEFDRFAILRVIEARFGTLEEAGCKVGIGVATGADQAFIAPFETLDVEPERKLPLVMTCDILSGKVVWQGFGVVNPFEPDGSLADFDRYPRFALYIEERRAAINKRHVSQKNPRGWYRTIDRIYPELLSQPKLLIPDIKGEANVVFDEGRLYPHHNLYYVTSKTWNLRALQTILRSAVAGTFIAMYSTKMRGGYLRFQAQYLRRIRLPKWEQVTPALRKALIACAEETDQARVNDVAFAVYGLSPSERLRLCETNR